MNPFATRECNVLIRAAVTNIDNKTQISIKEGNAVLSQNDFEFDAYTKTIRIRRNIKGTVNYEITVTNPDGTASAKQTITCIEPELPPVITITQPAISPYNTFDCKADIKASVKNVREKSNISIYAGSQKLGMDEFTFDAASGNISMVKSLSQSTLIKIVVTNSAGTASSEVTINCMKKTEPPEVTIITPATDPYYSSQCNAYVVAKTKRIVSKNQISIYKNGVIMDGMYYNFNEDEGEIIFDQGLTGETTFRIVVVNEGGSAEDKVTIKCASPTKTPDIKIITPTSNPEHLSSCRANIQARITEMGEDGRLEIRENGKIIPASNYKFDKSSGLLNLTREFIEKTSIAINVSNQAGIKTETIVFTCSNAEKLPSITITLPVENPYNTVDCELYLTADIMHVDDQNGISIQLNGKEIDRSQFTFNAGSGKLVLKTGNLPAKAYLTITAKNDYGTTIRGIDLSCKP